MATSVFISWSGSVAQHFGRFFAEWLKLPLGTVQTFYSPDIEKGSRWSDQIMQQLASCHFGIIVVTSRNLQSEWIHFEAGALSQAITRTGSTAAVTPLLIDIEPYQLPSTLAQFQATRCTRDEMRSLLTTIRDLGESDIRPSNDIIDLQLDAHWPRFEQALSEARGRLSEEQPEVTDGAGRSQQGLLNEIRAEIGNLRQLNEFVVRRLASDERPRVIREVPVMGARSDSTLDDQLAPIATYQFSTENDATGFASWLVENYPAVDFQHSEDGTAVSLMNYDDVNRYDRLLVQNAARNDFDGERLQ